MTSFSVKVYRITKQIPLGKVATYGSIAKKLGKPKAARAVGNALHHNPDPKTIPCYRVVNREGRLAPNFAGKGWREQKRRLVREGVKFKDRQHVDLGKFSFTF
jgi:methylated-DNA-protein-cysteine methyltransferase-like protein